MVTTQKTFAAQPVTVRSAVPSRTAYIDNLRIYLTLLVIFHHAAIAYGGAGDWGVKDRITDEISPILLSIFNGVNQAYFMATFFLLAGYFTPVAFARKGGRQFLVDRLIRLGVPLLLYSTLVINLNGYLLDRFYRGEPFHVRIGYAPGHLWFLQVLLGFAVVYWLWQGLAGHCGQTQGAHTPHPFPTDRRLCFVIGVLAILTFVMRIYFPVGVWFWGIQPGHFVHYIFAFCAGILAYHNGWFDALPVAQAKRWGIGVLLGIPAFGLVGLLAGILDDPTAMSRMMGGVHWAALLYGVWESFFLIAAMIFLLHLFRSRFNQAGPSLRWLAVNLYTVYIIHQTVLYAANIALLQVGLPSIVKFFLAALLTIVICFPLSGLIRRLPGATRIL